MGKNKVQSIDEVTEKMGYDSTLDVTGLENMIVNDFNRKLDFGREIKKIIIKHKIPTTSLRNEFAEALEVFENYGKDEVVKETQLKKNNRVGSVFKRLYNGYKLCNLKKKCFVTLIY